jgi:hypothetical protein
MTQQAPSADLPPQIVDRSAPTAVTTVRPLTDGPQSNAAFNNAPSNDRPVIRQADLPGVPPVEIGGRDGPEPTRYGDWEMRGRCIDF